MNQTIFALSFPQIETGRGFIVEATDSYGAMHIFTHAGFVLLLTVNCYTLFLYLQKGYLDKQKIKSIITATLKKIIPDFPRNLISHCNVAGIKRKRYHAAHRTGSNTVNWQIL